MENKKRVISFLIMSILLFSWFFFSAVPMIYDELPTDDIIFGMGPKGLIFFVGFIFIIMPLITLVLMCVNSNNWIIVIIKDKALSIYIGLFFIVLGIAAYSFMCSGGDSLSIIDLFKINGSDIIPAVIFIVGGVYIIMASFLPKKTINVNIRNSDEPSENQSFEENLSNLVGEAKTIVNSYTSLKTSVTKIINKIIVILVFVFVCVLLFIAFPSILAEIIIIPIFIYGLVLLLKSLIPLIQSTFNSNNFQGINSTKFFIYSMLFLIFIVFFIS